MLHKKRTAQRKAFRQMLAENDVSKKKTITKQLSPKWWRMAAVLFLTAAISIISYQFFSQQTPQELALQQWQTANPVSITKMSNGDGVNKVNKDLQVTFDLAYKAYKNKKYDSVLEILKNIPILDGNVSTELWQAAKELQAATYFEMQDYAAAVEIYKTILQQDVEARGQIKMKLALCYLADEQIEKAKSILEELQHLGQFEEQAKKLLKAIK